MKKVLTIAVSLLLVLSLVGCGGGNKAPATPDADGNITVKVGVVGEKNEVWEFVADKLAKEGIIIKLVTFTDYQQPNDALASGDLDLNSFQHYKFLNQYNTDKGTDLIAIGDTIIAPLALYSNQIQSIDEFGEGDRIAIPEDPTNYSRSLALLETAGLITLDHSVTNPGLEDVVENPLGLDILPMDPSQTVRALDDVKASVINNDFAEDAGLTAKEDGIFVEPVNEFSQPYINVIAARAEDANNEIYLKIVDAYQQDDTKEVIDEVYHGSQIPAWEFGK